MLIYFGCGVGFGGAVSGVGTYCVVGAIGYILTREYKYSL
jgi:hypothetical protein